MAAGDTTSVLSHGLITSGSGSCDYPTPDEVAQGVVYDFGGLVGTAYFIDPPVGGGIPTQASPFAAILQAIVFRISAATGIGTDFIRPVASDDYKVTETEDRFLYIRPYKPTPFVNAGAGRLARSVSRFVRVYLYIRSGVDSYGGDEKALMGDDPSVTYAAATLPGIIVQEELIYNSLDDWAPTDTNGNMLTLTVIHTTAENDAPERKPENEEGLVRSCLDFEVTYLLPISPAEPAP